LFGRLERTASVAEILPGDDAVANEGEEHEDDELDGVVEAERDGVAGADPSADNEVPGGGVYKGVKGGVREVDLAGDDDGATGACCSGRRYLR
jgi:hypothetical protein